MCAQCFASQACLSLSKKSTNDLVFRWLKCPLVRSWLAWSGVQDYYNYGISELLARLARRVKKRRVMRFCGYRAQLIHTHCAVLILLLLLLGLVCIACR